PVMTDDPVDQFQADLDQGELFEHLGRYDEAETAFRSLIAKGDPGELASLELGEMFERRGRAADAAEVYKEALARDPGETRISAALARVGAHGRAPPLASIRDEAARALLAPAAALILEKNDDGALACLRLSLRLDPDLDQGWVLVGDVMSEKGDITAARTAYATPGPKSAQYAEASGKLAWSYQNAGDKKTALATAQKAYLADPNSEVAAVNLADLERADGKDQDSVDVLDRLIDRPGERPDWRLLYMRAAAYQEEGRWPDAERDLEAALKLAPDQPELLNFLGYSWIDRGENLKQAIQMVQKAVDLDPQSGAMLDSLGWGYYRLGDYKTAVAKLEDAAALDAGDPDVNNHLGDAYWKVGRRAEAQFQWRRVLSLDPNAKLRSEIEIKLRSGLNDQMTPSDLDGS
ncbi:MAG: tetratricopeptide repeat protein, partial [Caulobacteraceae bacterium]